MAEETNEVARLEALISEYVHAFMDRVVAEGKAGANPEQLAELKRQEAFAFNGLANVMIDVENRGEAR